jgi:hypothetical protein
MVILCIGSAALPAGAQTVFDAGAAEPPSIEGHLLPLPPATAATPSSRTLTSLQISFAALQALDVYSTVRGVNHGMSEANPLMRGLARHPAAMATVKAGAAASTILLVRHVAKKNRIAGIAVMAAMNTALSVVVVRNLGAPGRQ